MSRVVLGVGASHTTLMNTRWHEVAHLDRAWRFRDALGEARSRLERESPDLVVVIGSNHFRGMGLDLMPAFTIGVGELICAGEHGTPTGAQLTDPAAALALCGDLIESGFDVAFSAEMHVDHGISHAIQYLLPADTPIVAIILNCFAPPLPTPARTCSFGSSLGAAVRRLPGNRKVGVIGTGGLSHALPFPDWASPESDDDRFLVESWRHGRADWVSNEQRRRRIILRTPPAINSEFDGEFLTAVAAGEHEALAGRLGNRDLVAAAGNGGNEIRAWLAMCAATDSIAGEVLAYSAMPEWLTGMAVATFMPAAAATAARPAPRSGPHGYTPQTADPTGGQQ